jgi:phage tail-like protein
MATPRVDPFKAFNFSVDGLTGTTNFSEVTGLNVQREPAEYREGTDKFLWTRKIPALCKFGPITFKRGQTTTMDIWSWFKSTMEGTLVTRNVIVTLINDLNVPVMFWTIQKAWPTKYDAPTFNAKTNEIAIESLEITYDGGIGVQLG